MSNVIDCVEANARESFENDGFFIGPSVLPPDLLHRVVPRMDAIIGREYETGVPPHDRAFSDDDPPTKLRKIDQPQLCDRTVHELVSHPALGELAAQVTGAKMIQVWAVQQLVKPGGGGDAAMGNVGWHQDWQYWRTWWEPGSEVFTAWVAVSDVKADMGPMKFVRGSHTWGFEDEGAFYEQNLESQRDAIANRFGATWEEVPAIIPAGAVTFHHCMTYHGSGPNTSAMPRRSYALHMRTENSAPLKGSTEYYPTHLDDLDVSPIIYDAR